MQSITVYAHAKINLFLGIVGEYGQGFHAVAMVLQSISLADTLTLTPHPSLTLTCDHPSLPRDPRNLAYRAAQLLQEHTRTHQGIAIHLQKHIPIGAGLAGGSADAAAVLVGLNHLWHLGLTLPELAELASQLGSDVPFCVMGGTMLATGRGEILEPLPPLHLHLVILKPRDLSISTPWAYQTHRQLRAHHPDWQPTPIQPLLQAIHRQASPAALAPHLHNDLEWPVFLEHPPLADLKTALAAHPQCLAALMSGSGSALFALCPDAPAAHHLAKTFRSPTLETWAVTSLDHGISLA
jgi:4-diphosphocytidyl-2-C-methyl-D-erythritol kinase